MKKRLIISLFTLSLSTTAIATDINSGLDDQSAVTLTIYNSDLGLVKDTRKISRTGVANKSINTISFKGVSAMIIPETSLLKDVQVKEQNYAYDLLSHESMLSAMLNQRISVEPLGTGKTIEATLLSINGERLILKADNGKILSLPKSASNYLYSFASVPQNLTALPTLTMQLYPEQQTKDNWELTYLTAGLSWKADYVIKLNKNNEMDVSAWLTLKNNTSVNFKNAQVNLLAGDIQRAYHPNNEMYMGDPLMALEAPTDYAIPATDIGDYKIYRLPFKTDVLHNQQKQVKIFDSFNAKYKKTYSYTIGNNYYRDSGRPKNKANINIEFNNSENNGLGLPMPKGVIRFYEFDNSDELQFSGGATISHTDVGEHLSFNIGEAFGITINGETGNDIHKFRDLVEKNVLVTVTNSNKRPITLKLIHPFHSNMQIIKSSLKHLEETGLGHVFNVTVPARSTKEVKYSTLTQY